MLVGIQCTITMNDKYKITKFNQMVLKNITQMKVILCLTNVLN